MGREEEDDDDGPPPGFDSIAINSQLEKMVVEDYGGEDDEDDGPPPGFSEPQPPQVLSPPLSISHSDTQLLRNQGLSDVQIGRKQCEDRPPLGCHSTDSKQPPSCMRSSSELVSDIQMENNQRIDDGPPTPKPPGWQLNSQQQQPPESTPLLVPHSTPSSDIQTGATQKDDDDPPPGWQLIPSQQKPRDASDIEMGSEQQSIKDEDKRLLTDKGPPMSSEVGQLVCGTCRQLLSYPRGSKWVQCSACRTVNLALEAHEVGQVKCGGCTMLLMYPYGAHSVKCSSCHFTTRIGAHNRRPHLAAQQARRLRRPPHHSR